MPFISSQEKGGLLNVVKSYMVTTLLSVETALDILYNFSTESVAAAPSLLILIFNHT